MTNSHSTAYVADLENLPLNPIARIAEDEGDYQVDKPTPTAPTTIRLDSEALRAYLKYCQDEHGMLTTRISMQLDDLDHLLSKQEDVDIFDLLVEHTLIGDEAPAKIMSDLMAVLDDDALVNLETRTIAHAGEFIRDRLKQEAVRWHLKEYHEEREAEQDEGSQE